MHFTELVTTQGNMALEGVGLTVAFTTSCLYHGICRSLIQSSHLLSRDFSRAYEHYTDSAEEERTGARES